MAVQLAHALTTGNSFLGHLMEKPLKVLYYQCDLPEGEWQEQLKGLDHNANWHTIWEMPGILSKKERTKDLHDTYHDGKFDMLVLDSLVRCAESLDLNDQRVVDNTLVKIRYITGDKPTFTVHHKRKGSPGVADHMGTSAFGSFAVGAGWSTLIDLTDGGIDIRGRYVRRTLELKRGEKGVWLTKTEGDLYKMS